MTDELLKKQFKLLEENGWYGMSPSPSSPSGLVRLQKLQNLTGSRLREEALDFLLTLEAESSQPGTDNCIRIVRELKRYLMINVETKVAKLNF